MSRSLLYLGLGAAVGLTLGLLIGAFAFGSDVDPKALEKCLKEKDKLAKAAAAADEPKSAPAPTARREPPRAEPTRPQPAQADLKLPSSLPPLQAVPGRPAEPMPAVGGVPFKPVEASDPKLELEGNVTLDDANAAMRAVFPEINKCYQDLRVRAPQAGGRMLLRFKMKTDEAEEVPGKTPLSDYFVRETQFTDPGFLDCVRKSFNERYINVGARTIDGTVTMPLWLAQDPPK
jgi:hypothetical protein